MNILTKRFLDMLTGKTVRLYMVNNTVLKGDVVLCDEDAILLDMGSKLGLFFRHAIMSVAVDKEEKDD